MAPGVGCDLCLNDVHNLAKSFNTSAIAEVRVVFTLSVPSLVSDRASDEPVIP